MSYPSIELCQKITTIFDNHIEFFLADTRAIPIRDETFDIVYSQGLIEHFSSPFAPLREQIRILAARGILIINVPQKYTGYALMKNRLMREGRWELGWETSFSYRDLRKMGDVLDLIEREVFGYQYWKSWAEPIFVLRDLYDKLDRRFSLSSFKIFASLKNAYDDFWATLETHWGHYFMQNIVIVYQKKQ